MSKKKKQLSTRDILYRNGITAKQASVLKYNVPYELEYHGSNDTFTLRFNGFEVSGIDHYQIKRFYDTIHMFSDIFKPD